jgi:hypothetical protein
MNVQRHVPGGVLPLEVWDFLVQEREIWTLPEPELPRAICTLVTALREGRARRARAGTTLPLLAIDRVVLGGGGVTEPAARALRAAGFDALVYPDPVWIGEAGGRALLEAFSPSGRGAVLEIGQTSVKYSDEEGRVRLPRPLACVPIESDSRAQDQAALRLQTLRFFAEAPRARRLPDALVLALPCELDGLRVAGCSYPWQDGDPTLIADLLTHAGLAAVPTRVLNDAELAAVSVSRSFGPRTLVLTLGMGLGGAYLQGSTHAQPSAAG